MPAHFGAVICLCVNEFSNDLLSESNATAGATSSSQLADGKTVRQSPNLAYFPEL